MDINTCDKYDLDNITLDKPKKVDDVYISNVNFALQTPKINIEKISKKLVVVLDEKMENVINEFDTKIINLISENSDDFFEEKLSIEDADEIYKGSVKSSKHKTKMSISLNKKLSIFNKHKEQLNINSLVENDSIICLLKCKKIIFYKNYCEPLWEVFQIKLKEKQLNTKQYLFVEDSNDTYEELDINDNDDFSVVNKINIKKEKSKHNSNLETEEKKQEISETTDTTDTTETTKEIRESETNEENQTSVTNEQTVSKE